MKTTTFKHYFRVLPLLCLFAGSELWAAPSANLDQVRNGTAAAPNDPGEWVNGNAGAQNSHYIEGHSIVYRCRMDELTAPLPNGATNVVLELEYDVKHSDTHAIDYLTYYDRLLPHSFTDDNHFHPEALIPTSGVTFASAPVTVSTFPIPAPGTNGTPVAGQPTASFNALPAGERVFTLWGGIITDVYYGTEGDLSQTKIATSIIVEFTPTDDVAVLSWGGHIASRLDWGFDNSGTPRSAGGISGSPYHMRLIDWNLSNLGNQDRSLSAAAVIPPPTCGLTGPSDVCASSTNSYVIDTDAATPTFSWTLTNNTAGASFVGGTASSNVNVTTTTSGSYDVKVVVGEGSLNSECTVSTTVNPAPTCSITGGPTSVCPGAGGLTYSAPPGMDSYSWSISGDGSIVGSSTNETVTVNAGVLCGTGFTLDLIVSLNGCTSTCSQFVDVNDTTPPVIDTCPTNISVQCAGDVPAVNTNLIDGTDNCGTVIQSHVSDVSDNGSCPEVITRTYRLTDGCGNSSNCVQLITIDDTIAPSLIGVPTNLTVECDSVPAQAVVTATDNCSTNLTVVPSTNTIPGSCIGAYTIEYVWSVTDDCNNSTVATQTVTVVDTTPPVIDTCASNVTVQCFGDVPAPNTNLVSGTDNCGTVTVAWEGDLSDSNSCPEVITRTYSLTDDCGNATNCTVTITVNDTINPVLVDVPTNITVECDSVPTQAVVTATDNCATNLTVVPSTNKIDGACIGEYTLEYIWSVTDDCNNSTVATQSITVVDTTPPVIDTCASNVTVECIGDVPAPNTSLVSGTDNCGTVTVAWEGDLSDSNSCPEVITRTYSLTDDCGNATNCTVTITVNDTINPVLVGVPTNITVECDSVPTQAVITATDNCATNLTVVPSTNKIDGACIGEYTLEYIWSVTDDCNNSMVATQTVTVVDTTPPVIDTCPTNVTVQCIEDVPVVDTNLVSGTDNCGIVTVSWIGDLSDSNSCPEIITRTYQLIDECDNITNCVQTITVNDTINPVLVGVPTNLTVECDSVPTQAVVTATDNCATNLTVVPSTNKIDGACIGEYTLEYIWSVTDDCNNSSVATQTVTVVDTTPPVIDTCASNVIVQCFGDVPAPNTNLVSGTDNCGTVSVTWGGDVSDSGSCPEVITRTYTLTDDCGNATNCTVTITVNDTINPVLVGVPTNITVECDSVPTQAVVTATDNCATNLTVVPSTNKIDGACIGEYTLEYIWSVTDDCNNSSVATQSITVVDTTPPVIDTCASNVIVECIGDVPAPNTNLVSGTDNCGTVSVTWGGDVSDSGSCPEVITRTYTLTDDCGNATNCTVTITVNDTINPVLVDVPTNITVECDSVPTQAVVSATDNCATNLTVVPSTNKIDGACIGEYTLEYIWSVTDDCNNSTVATQSITVVDTTPPVIDTCASNVVVECIGDVPAPNTNLVSGTDNCGTVTVAWEGDLSDSNSCPEVITRTYSLTDDCGNATNCTVTITVNDTINPVLVGVPTNITVECDSVPTQAVVSATDNCSTNLTVVPSTNKIDGACIGEYTLEYIWSVTDDCNNSTVATQTVTVVDTTPPVIDTCASNVIVQCFGDVPAPNTNLVSGTDNCGTVTVAWEGDLSDSNSCPEVITRTYSLTDDCGNATNCTVTITVNDTINPVLVDVPTNITVECDSVPTQAVVTATDNCSTNLTVVPSTNKIDGACIGEYTLEYIWSVTDDCNNSTVATQSITVVDTTPPVIDTCASNVIVECIGDVPAPNTNLVSGTDNCGTVTVAWEGDLSDSNSCPEIITRTYSLTDDCGNATNCTVTITVNDTINPVLVDVPTNLTVECDSVPTQAVVTATDNCATNLTVVPSTNKIDGACIGEYTLEYIWSVTDDCNNSTVATQSITVVDTTPPVIDTCASNVTVQCFGDVPAPNTNLVSGTDNCGTVSVTWGGDVSDSGSCPEIITRTYTLTDDCGNATNCSVTITVNDTINPVLVDVPTNITVECDSVPTQAVVTATDNCSTNLTVVPSTNKIDGACIGEYTLEYIWSVTDDCNNSTVATQSITVVDTTPPVIDTCASNVIVECIGDVPAPNTNLVSGTDNCGTVTVAWEGDLSDSNSCPEIITRTYSLTDDCGNATNCTVTITVNDTINPVLVDVPTNLTVECDSVPTQAVVTATDNCATNLTVVPSTNKIDGACIGEYTLEYIWSLTDDCNNSTVATQTVTVVDTTPPVIDTCASNVIVECIGDVPAPNTNLVSGTDNCGTVTVAWEGDLSDSNSCPEIITRTYSLTDDCGNATNCTVTITVNDTINPVLVDVPTNLTVECDSVPTQAVVTATDNCATNLTVVPSTNKIGGACIGEYTLEYIWSVTDDCNNSTVATQSITVVDTTPPVIDTCASNVTVQCFGDVPAPNTNLVSGTDNCGTVTVAWEGDLSDSNSCPEVITRTYSLTDDCGNATNCTVTITVNDTINPVLVDVPTNITVECDNVPTQAVVTATDNCSTNLTVVPSTNKIDGACIGEYTLEYIWSVTDDCNNSTVATQTVTVVDTTPPVIDTCASNVIVECIGDVPAPNTNLVSGTDNCGTVTVAWEGDLSDSNSCPEVITRTYSLTDDCGNATNCTVTITVNDTINPVLVGVPTNLTVECDSVPTQAVVTATDNCSTNLTVVPSTNKIDGACIGEYTLEYIWSVTDDCNNSTVATQSITVVDTTPPVIDTCASNVIVECISDVPAPNTNLVSGTDNCGTVTVAWEGDLSDSNSCPEVITRTYSLTDDCGNATNCTVTITVNDTINPVLVDVPTNITVECDSVPTQAVVTATDNCSTNLTVVPSINKIDGACIGEYTLEYIWSVTDDCNNSTVATQSITVVDTTPPVIDTCASNVIVECIGDVPAPNTNLVSGTDNCGTVTVAWEGDLSDSNSCPEIITRTYSLTDDCGNATNCTVTITVNDIINPVLVDVPTNITVECDSVPTQAVVTATDNCATNLTVVPSTNKIDGACIGEYTLEYIWSVTDDCNNSTVATQSITVVDTTPPVIDTCASNVTVQCFGDVPAPNTNLVSGTDNCGTVSVTWGGDVSDSGSCPEVITRTYTLTDDCGNATNCSVTITVNDTINPILVDVPTNITVECDSVPTQAVVTATDNCATNLTVIPSTNKIDGACIGEYTLEYIWSVTDDCNNSTVATQSITVVDTTPPVIDTCASNVAVQCDTDIPPVNTNLVTGTDNCGTVTVTWGGDLSDSNSCPELITRTYILTDDCGNATNCSQLITVHDTERPEITCPSNVVLDCNVPFPAPETASVVVTDNCSTGVGEIVVTHISDVAITNGCDVTVTRTYRAEDECGNSTNCTQTLSGHFDTEAPTVFTAGSTLILCGMPDPGSGTPQISDNCDPSPTVIGPFKIPSSGFGGCVKTDRYIWQVTDNCGNQRVAVRLVTQIDLTPPPISCPPDVTVTSTVACIEFIPDFNFAVTDLCVGAVVQTVQTPVPGTQVMGPTTVVVNLSATDLCGNTANCSFNYNIECTPGGELGDYVWEDTNLDGLQDGGEPGVSNVTVRLYDANTNFLDSTSTDTNGLYLFVNKTEGDYLVEFIAPSNGVFTLQDAGVTNDTIDSDVNIASGFTELISLGHNETNLTIDAGLVLPAADIQLLKTVNIDALQASCPGVELVQGTNGTPVTYCLVVTNTGNTFLSDVFVEDLDVSPTYTNTIAILAPGASVTLAVPSTIQGDLVNTASVVAVPAYSDGTPIPGVPPVMDDDPAEVRELDAGLEIRKTAYTGVLGEGSSGCPGAEVTYTTNLAPVVYCLEVENIGLEYVVNIEVSDLDTSPTFSTNLTVLAPGEIANLAFQAQVFGTLTNTATVNGSAGSSNGVPYPDSSAIYDEDTATVVDLDASMTLEKTVYVGNSGSAGCTGAVEQVQVVSGTTVTYCFELFNTGSAELSSPTLADPGLSVFVSLGANILPGESRLYTRAAVVTNSWVNSAQAQAQPTDPNTHIPYAVPKLAEIDSAEVVLIAPLQEASEGDEGEFQGMASSPVSTEGIHRVSAAVLSSAGLSDLSRVAVYLDGLEVAVHVEWDGGIMFYVPNGTQEAVYGEKDSPLRMEVLPAAPLE